MKKAIVTATLVSFLAPAAVDSGELEQRMDEFLEAFPYVDFELYYNLYIFPMTPVGIACLSYDAGEGIIQAEVTELYPQFDLFKDYDEFLFTSILDSSRTGNDAYDERGPKPGFDTPEDHYFYTWSDYGPFNTVAVEDDGRYNYVLSDSGRITCPLLGLFEVLHGLNGDGNYSQQCQFVSKGRIEQTELNVEADGGEVHIDVDPPVLIEISEVDMKVFSGIPVSGSLEVPGMNLGGKIKYIKTDFGTFRYHKKKGFVPIIR